ncbi:MAG: hypothetical protein QXG57_09110 [Thermofilaceae archaeon]
MIRYVCGNCGFVLYEFKVENGGRGFTNILEPGCIIEMYSGVCPRCGKKLEPVTTENWRERIRVRPKLGKLVKT